MKSELCRNIGKEYSKEKKEQVQRHSKCKYLVFSKDRSKIQNGQNSANDGEFWERLADIFNVRLYVALQVALRNLDFISIVIKK